MVDTSFPKDQVSTKTDQLQGLGQQLIWDINVYEFEKATTSVILIILLITAIDRLCLYLRKKIL